MSKPMSLDDFRAVRIVLEPDDFALGPEEPDPPPSDLVSTKAWRGLIALPDDVAVRTSNHHGRALGQVYAQRIRWITATGQSGEALFEAMLDAGDDLENSAFNALHGYYRAGFSALRSVLEVMTIGTCGSFGRNRQIYGNWRNGAAEFSFGTACDRLSSEPMLAGFNAELRKSGTSLFDAKGRTRGAPSGHGRQWYAELCNYAHSRPGFGEGDLWQSNGPIYVREAFGKWHRAWLHTVSLCAVLILIGRPQADRKDIARMFTDRSGVVNDDLRRALSVLAPRLRNSGARS